MDIFLIVNPIIWVGSKEMVVFGEKMVSFWEILLMIITYCARNYM